MRFLLVASLFSSVILLGCDQTSAIRRCSADDVCGADRCLDGRCAPALEDPGGDAMSPGSRARVFAVGLHPTLADVVTQTTWRDFVRARFARDVVPQLSTERPNFVVLPENTTLTTVLIGARGESGRAATTSTAALTSVLAAQTAAVEYYDAITEPGLPLGRLLGVVVTDTVWRAIEPFRELARDHGIWIALTGGFAMAERTTDAAAIAAVVDEAETDRSFAWIATSDDVHDQTLLIGPDGEIVHAFRKVYLSPNEEAPTEGSGRDLDYGVPEDLRAFDLPFARVASVIDDDAWMPDVLDRLALDGAALMLQPEAFGGWAISHDEHGSWPPDVMQESGWSHVMRYPEFQASVLPCWNGNFFELVFDCQSSIVVQPRHDAARGAWIGQDDEPGYARVAPWAIPDDRAGTIAERRDRSMAHGELLSPGSGAPEENAYTDGAVLFDLDLATPWPTRTPDPAEIAISTIEEGEQRRPTLALTEGGFAIFWEDTRRGQTRIYGAVGALAGEGIAVGEARVRVTTTGEPRRLRAASAGDEIHLVWQETRGEDHDAMHAASVDGGRSFGVSSALGGERAESAPQWTPDVAIGVSGVWATWIDRGQLGARVYAARIVGSGSPAGTPVVALGGDAYDTRGNQHAPSIAFAGDFPVIVWADFAAHRWEIHGARFDSDGSGFVSYRVDDADVPFETLHSDPRVVVTSSGPLVVWTDLRARRADYDVRVALARPAATSIALATTDDRARPQWRPAIAARGSRVVAVWQDMRDDHQSLRFAVSSDAGATFAADAPVFPTDDGVDRYDPEVLWLDTSHALVAYETTASGSRRIAARVLPL